VLGAHERGGSIKTWWQADGENQAQKAKKFGTYLALEGNSEKVMQLGD